jgi:OOP family OmpA-OmpF porin
MRFIVNNLKKLALGMTALVGSSMLTFAEAAPVGQNWYVGPMVTYMKPDTGFGVDKRDFGFGARFGTAIAPNWDLQIGTMYTKIDDNGGNYKQTTLGVDALYMFSRAPLRPFVLAGIGAERDKADFGGASLSKTSPYIDAGLGLQYAFNDKVSLQADYRRVHGFISNGSAFASKRPNNDYLTVGLNIAFGQ